MVSDATFSLEMKKTLCCLLVGWCSIAHAQKLATTPAFEVSTVRPSSQDAQESNLNLGPDGIRSSNLPVIFLLKFAFNLNAGSNDQIVGAPPWLSSLPFDIHAKVGEETAARLADMPTDERIAATRNMIRALLADRFGLRVHYESRKLSVLALTVTKGGSKLTPTNDKPASETPGADAWTGLHNPGAGQTEGRDVPVALLVNALSSKPEIDGRLVVDETGLTGKYSFKLIWTPEDPHAATGEAGAGGPSLFTALQEQLGLKLEARKAPVDCVVIDHIEQPSPN
jgi:uncharacterized protein (TIGR03435 family)